MLDNFFGTKLNIHFFQFNMAKGHLLGFVELDIIVVTHISIFSFENTIPSSFMTIEIINLLGFIHNYSY